MRPLSSAVWRLLIVAAFLIGGGGTVLLLSTSRKTDELAQTRRQAIIVSCEDSNRRHDNAIRQLDRLIGQIPPGPRRERARQSRASTVLLIDALAPKFDCEARADRLSRPDDSRR